MCRAESRVEKAVHSAKGSSSSSSAIEKTHDYKVEAIPQINTPVATNGREAGESLRNCTRAPAPPILKTRLHRPLIYK